MFVPKVPSSLRRRLRRQTQTGPKCFPWRSFLGVSGTPPRTWDALMVSAGPQICSLIPIAIAIRIPKDMVCFGIGPAYHKGGSGSTLDFLSNTRPKASDLQLHDFGMERMRFVKISCPKCPTIGGGVNYFLCSPLFGEDEPNLTSIFFKGVGSTTN